ncbi:MAG: site-2 protease family protein [Gammaproteobacteria bacterium]|nr:site-2 protease family protein [Gammaproteobacteria bacterium]
MTVIERIAIWLLPVMFAIIIHEIAHGWAALRLGDTTAKSLGRLSLNPIRHIDPVGSIVVPGLLLLMSTGFIFGWARPVPINASRLHNPRRDMMVVAIAGPFSNLMMLLFWAFVFKTGLLVDGGESATGFVMIHMGAAGIFINAVLMMLNLLPIPPLDGSRVVEGLLPLPWAVKYNQFGRYGLLVLMGLMFTGLLGSVLWPLISVAIVGSTFAANLPLDVLSQAFGNLFGT